MANIDRIVNVQINLNTNNVSAEGFNTILVVGEHSNSEDRVKTYTNINDLTEDGFTTTDPIYKAVSTAFSQSPHPSIVKVGQRRTSEEIADTMNAIMAEDNDFYGIVLASRETDDILAMAEWVETQTKLFGTSTSEETAKSTGQQTDLISTLKAKNYYRTFAFYHELADDEYIEAGIMAKCFNIEPGGETWANKILSGLTADNLTEAEYLAIFGKNGNTFEAFRNNNITQNGKVVGGEWIDVIRFRDWLQENITVNVFNLLINNNKIPYTDAGIALVENQVNSSLLAGQRMGGIAPTEYDENNVENPGYVITVPLASSIPANTKATRVLEGITFTARLAGAIHAVEITGSFTYENLTV